MTPEEARAQWKRDRAVIPRPRREPGALPKTGQLWRWDALVFRVTRVSGLGEWADIALVTGGAWRKRQRLPFPQGAELVVEAFGTYVTQPALFDLEEISA